MQAQKVSMKASEYIEKGLQQLKWNNLKSDYLPESMAVVELL